MSKTHRSIIAAVLSIVLSLSLAFTGIAPYVHAAEENVVVDTGAKGAPSADSINKALSTFSKVVGDLSKDVSKEKFIHQVAMRFGGVTGAVSGGIAVLQMVGILEDPDQKKHEEIISNIKQIQEQLQTMDNKLNTISEQLTALAATIEEKDRQNKARQLLSYYRKFNTDYVQPLNNMVTQYQSIINDGTAEWWKASKTEGYRVLYTSNQSNEVLAFAKGAYSAGFPDKATNGEAILKDSSIGFSPAFMEELGLGANNWDINKQFEVFTNAAKTKIVNELNNNSSDKVDVTPGFRTKWNALSNDDKNKKAEKYAIDLFNTVKSRIAIKKMTENNAGFVTNVANAYNNYVKNLTMKDSGLDAILNVQYMTHAFEKETANDINQICDSMVANAGFYGSFAMSVVAQSENQTEATAIGLRDSMVNAINFVDQKKKLAITGNPNYCYMTGSVVDFNSDLRVASSMEVKTTAKEYRGMVSPKRSYKSSSFKSWKVYDSKWKETSVPAIVNDTWANVLYHYYQQQKSGNETFAQFLNKNGVNIPKDFKGEIMTKYVGVQNFPLSDNLSMTAKRLYGDYFSDNSTYGVNVSGSSGRADKCFTVHDKVVYNYINAGSGQFNSNKVLAARAAFLEDHWFWGGDEASAFTYNCNCNVKQNDAGGYRHNYNVDWNKGFNILTLKNVKKKNVKMAAGDSDVPEAESPIDAFDDASYYDAPEDPDIPIDYKDADWDSDDIDYIDEMDYEGDRAGDGIEFIIDNAVDRANDKGIDVSLTDEEKDILVNKMREVIKITDNELKTNSSVRYKDIFGIDQNEELLKNLYNKVVYSDEGPGYRENMVPMKNVSTMANYESSASIDFRLVDGNIQTVINPEYNIDANIVEYDSVNNEYMYYHISDDVMKELGLKMNVRIPVNFLKDNDYAHIKHFENDYDKDLIEEFKSEIIGDANSRYSQVVVTSCSPFEVEGGGVKFDSLDSISHVKPPKTGDDNIFFAILDLFL